MGLSATVQQGVVSAFNALGDLVKRATYKHVTGDVVRDLDAGTSTPTTTDYTMKRTIIVRFKDNTEDKDIIVETDAKFLAPAVDLPVDPATNDLIVDFRNRTWRVVKNMVDPANGAIVLLVRKS